MKWNEIHANVSHTVADTSIKLINYSISGLSVEQKTKEKNKKTARDTVCAT